MKGKRTEPNIFQWITDLLITIGRPFLKTTLFSLYALIVATAWILKTTLQLIKLASLKASSTTKKFISLISSILHGLQPIFHKYSITLQTPIRLVLRFPKLKIPKIRVPRKKVMFATFTLTSLSALSIIVIITIIKNLPNPDKLITRDQIVSTKIYDRNGKLLYKIFKNENRTLIKLEDIPPYLIEATIAIEDKDFYKHAGYSYRGIARAIRQTILEKKLQGGSTITQQLVKNALLNQEQTLRRKIKEIILAVIVETKFTKDEILTMYFNEVGYGGAAYGVEEASLMYFRKSAKYLTLAEASLLAGLPVAPTYYSPFGTHPELAKFRQHEVLRRMVEDKFITAEEAETTKAQKLTLAPQKTDIKAPHFSMFVKQLLVEKFGEQLVEQGGLEVTTTLDLDIQNLAQKKVSQEVANLSKLNISNGAALVTKPQTGEILAMVGSKDFFDFEHDGQVNVTLRPRQPGSAIKPVNYSVALENGFTAATILSDTPITYHIPGQPPYSPKNYDDKFHGKITLRNALANSYNVPAVKTLSVFGVNQMIEKGRLMGITTWKDSTRYGLSLTLGGGDVKMIDLAVVYGALANAGLRIALQPILKVTNYRGEVLYQYSCPDFPQEKETKLLENQIETCKPLQVVSPEVSFILSDILSDNQARSQAFGLHSVLNIPKHQIVVKTGTTQNLRDNWTIGYTKDFLVAAWVGNNDNSSMSFVASGITGASPIWSNITSSLLANSEPHKFEPPDTLIQKSICPYTGTLACAGCSNRLEYFIPGTEPKTTCNLTNKSNNDIQQKSIDQTQPLIRPQILRITPRQLQEGQILEGIQTTNMSKTKKEKNKLPRKSPR